MKIIAALFALAGYAAAENLRPSEPRRLSKSSKSSSTSSVDDPTVPPYPYNPYDFLPPAAEFHLTSAEFNDGDDLPIEHASGAFGVEGGLDQSPSLSWSGFPEGTQSFVVTMWDPDAPTVSGFWHWAIYDIPASTTSLPLGAGSPDGALLPAGAKVLNNDAGFPGYVGAAAPTGRTHRYIFSVAAMPVEEIPGIGVSAPANNPILQFFMFNVGVIGRAFLTATFDQ